jgi:ABC-type multidrug transport system fused ATPase/permease subunit
MRQLTRLIRYVAPYWWQVGASVLLMAMVGLLDAFRLLLIGPIFDRVLNPGSQSREMQLFTVPGSGHPIYLQQFVPSHFQNPWTVVAFALVAATVLKGICDYAGTYLVNYAGFGMITDLRNDLYDSILRRSAAFFHKHTTGTLVSTIVNDVERVQYAMSSVLAEFLQQFFTFLFTALVVVALGRKFAWILVLFVPVIVFSAGRIGRRVRHTTRRGQDKLADIQNILHETITGNRIVQLENRHDKREKSTGRKNVVVDLFSSQQKKQSNGDGAKDIHQRRTDRHRRHRAQIGAQQPLCGFAEARDLPRFHAEGLHDPVAGNRLMKDVLNVCQLILPLARGVPNAAADLSCGVHNERYEQQQDPRQFAA